MKNLHLAFIATPLFLMACDEQQNQNNNETEASYERTSEKGKIGFVLQKNLHDLETVQKKNTSNLDSMIDQLQEKYRLNKYETKSLFQLGEMTECPIGGLTIGKYQNDLESETTTDGEWRLQTLTMDDEVISTDDGVFKIYDGQGKMFSVDSDNLIEATIFESNEIINFEGTWSFDSEQGEMVGIQLAGDSNQMVGIWTECRL
jgi:hypothetical protein